MQYFKRSSPSENIVNFLQNLFQVRVRVLLTFGENFKQQFFFKFLAKLKRTPEYY